MTCNRCSSGHILVYFSANENDVLNVESKKGLLSAEVQVFVSTLCDNRQPHFLLEVATYILY